MATGNCDAIQRHIERQARGRQQRLDKQDDGGKIMIFQARDQDCFDQILKTHQRNVAGRMLEDFHSSGVDEDLEVLKAGWANHFKVRPGQPQPQRPLLADLRCCDLDDDEPRSILAAQGERAKQRLKGLEQLRHMAESGTLKNQQGSNFAFSEGFLGGDLEKIPQLPRSNGPLRQAGKLLHEGPKESKKSKCKDLNEWNPHVVPDARGARGAPDPWAEWEARWSQEFRRLDEMEKNRRQVADGQQWSEREEEWHRRVQAEKNRREASASKTTGAAKTSKAKTSKEANEPKEATKPPPSRDPPVQPNLPKHQAKSAPKYHSFADFSAAWSSFEKKLQLGASSGEASGSLGHLSVSDIPWPDGLSSVSGTSSSDTPAEAKKKLRTALLRWHPDKWAPILEHVAPADRAEVISRVKLVTQRLLEEKKANDAK